ncbi:class I SAM-dependent methyltransferase [candidate division KSB1 bacterium]|nr:class I SAM-dependent methyltransferase [candidate division KSB1 bacterium]
MHKEWQGHTGEILGSKNKFDVIECENCDFKHVVPIPTEDFLSEYYKNSFVKNRPSGFYKKMEDDVPWLEIFYNEKYDLFEKHIKKQKPSILDIGSGLGYFIKCGKDRGWQAIGVEPSIESYNYSKKLGLVVVNEYLDEKNYQDLGKIDVVHMHEVLEHLPDPSNMIKLAKNMLNPGGLICIVSPNDFNPLQKAFVKIYDDEKWWISPPEHINYFDFSSIKNLLEKNGFTIVEQTSTFPLEIFLLMGENYISNDKVGKMIHSKRVRFERNINKNGYEEIRRNMYRKLSEIGIGREFCVIGKLCE